MTFEDLFNVIRIHFAANVTADIRYPNAPFEKPETQWVSFNILVGEAMPLAVASKRIRYLGVLIAQIFVPILQGDETGLELADEIVTLYAQTRVESGGIDVRFKTPSVNTIRRENEWHQININCPWYADDTSL